VLAILAAAALLFVTAPRAGEFWWSDAPRHALNGAFVQDLLREMPVDSPREWAVDYYYRYPALTILFYPPLFPLLVAAVFAVVGVSPWAAQLTVSMLLAAAGLGAYALARRWLDRGAATGAALLFMGMPEVGLWGRQVMLELPAYAFLIWSVWALLRYFDRRRPGWWYGGLLLFGMAMYTKQSVMFVAPALLAAGLVACGSRSLLRDRHVWIGSLIFVLGILPLAYMTIEFGGTNLQSVAGVQDAETQRWSLGNWLFYPRLLPAQMGWPLSLLAVAGLFSAASARRWRLPRIEAALMFTWVGVGYLFFSVISLKEQRLDIFVLLPLVLMAAHLVASAAPRRAQLVLPAVGAVLLASTAVFHQVPFISGYERAADLIASRAESNSVVMFSGLRDGSFIFNLRSHEERGDLSVVRADKLLLRVAVRRGLGVEQQQVEEAQFAEQLNRLGIRYVVADPDFWNDLENMQMLTRVLESDQFEQIASIPVSSNVSYAEDEIRVYRNLGPVAANPEQFTMRLEMIDTTLQRGR
jgi:4-amino-4-deoxy-L-arabinose transferase-like glycosyltransferase